MQDTFQKNIYDLVTKSNLTYKNYWLQLLERNQLNADKFRAIANKITNQLTIHQKRIELLTSLKISYPENLPVSQEIEELKKLVHKHQVVIVCGETGSGKTTQLPKMLLEMGYANNGIIGHTQPRRIAARSLATRIASEIGDVAQQIVAYKMRFNDKTGSTTSLKLMTDGILLQEIQNDRLLLQYSALIIDEVHERSLNIDFILGYLKSLLPKRPDLRVIITSATIENQRIAEFFDSHAVYNVTGKTYPVDVIYQPYEMDEDDVSLNQAIYQAMESALSVEMGNGLVFLPGEKEIKACANYLRKTNLKSYEILPLYSRQNAEEQAKVFNQNGRIKLILATNVAETSLTIPGIKFVIDTGIARVKRYSLRNRVEQLNVEAISQASSKQRMGRAGRVSHGLCVRLFSETEFKTRKEFSEPELLRSNLANVVLKLLAFKLGDARDFPFLDMPDNKAYNDGFRTLLQIGALDEANQLTRDGQLLAKIPIDVQLGKILLSASKLGSLKEALIIVGRFAIQDPREMIIEHQDLIRERHKIWYDERSEFVQILKLWQWYNEQVKHKKSNKKLIDLCHYHFLSAIRMREWHEMHRQLNEIAHALKLIENTIDADYDTIHKALLAGFALNVGIKDVVENYYRSTNGRKFYLHPSLKLKLKNPWIISLNLVETTRLYARFCAEIKPEWLNEVSAHLFKYTYDGVGWSAKRGQVVATKHALFFGLEISQSKIAYSSIDEAYSRQVMIKEGLVANDLTRKLDFIQFNQNIIREIEKIEDKLRTTFAIIDDELFNFYDGVIPANVFDLVSLENFIKHNLDSQLKLDKQKFITRLTNDVAHHELYPEQIDNNGIRLSVKYIFNHDSPTDGMNVRIKLTDLLLVNVENFEWLVTGLIREKITYLIKSLPKATRLMFNPQQESISRFLELAQQTNGLVVEFYKFALEQKIQLDLLKLQDIKFPMHLNCHFQIVDNKKIIADGDDLLQLRQQLTNKLDSLVIQNSTKLMPSITGYAVELNELLEQVKINQITGYNCLVVNKDSHAIECGMLVDIVKARQSTINGLIELFRLQLSDQIKYLRSRKFTEFNQVAMIFRSEYKADDLLNAYEKSIINTSIKQNLTSDLKFTQLQYEQALVAIRQTIAEVNLDFSAALVKTANLYQQLKKVVAKHLLLDEITNQLEWLIFPKFIEQTPLEFLLQYPRYLQAIIIRLEKYANNSTRDAQLDSEMQNLFNLWYDYCEELEGKNKRVPEQLKYFYYKLEELRISMFAQEIKTLYPISTKRLQRELDELIKHITLK